MVAGGATPGTPASGSTPLGTAGAEGGGARWMTPALAVDGSGTAGVVVEGRLIVPRVGAVAEEAVWAGVFRQTDAEARLGPATAATARTPRRTRLRAVPCR